MMPAGTVLFSSGAPIGYIAIAMLPGVEANHITFHNVGTVAATQICDLINQRCGFLIGNKTSGLYRIDQDL